MAETIGSQLRKAREAKGMSIEDVAFETRIHAPYVRALEADDYSGFAGTTYARSFLSLYSRFLDVNAEEALRIFAGGDDIQLGGNSYLPPIQTVGSATASSAKPSRGSSAPVPAPAPAPRRRGPGFAPVLLGIAVLALLAIIPTLWFLGKDADSFDAVTSKVKALADATRAEISTSAARVGTTAGEVDSSAATETPAPRGRPRPRSVAADWVTEGTATPVVTEPLPMPDPTMVAVAEPVANNLETELTKARESGRTTPGTPAPSKPETSRPSSNPGTNTNSTPKPAIASEPEPATPKTTTPPLRAVPFIARPIVVATEDDDNDPEETGSGDGSDGKRKKDRKKSGDRTTGGENRRTTTFIDTRNRFPRSQN